jgi:signal transduction histidine kinase
VAASGEQVGSGYAGPDRRGPHRAPPEFGLEDPRRRFWRRAALVVPPVALLGLAAGALSADSIDERGSIFASLYLCSCIAGLAAGVGFYLRWRMTGEAPIALLAAAMLVMALAQLPLSLADQTAGADEVFRRIGPLTRLVVACPTAWLLWRCLRSPEVDSRVRPLGLALRGSVPAFVLASAVHLVQQHGFVPPLPPVGAGAVDLLLAGFAFVLAVAFVRRPGSLEPAVATRVAVVGLGIGLSLLTSALAWWWWAPLSVPAALFCFMALLVMALLSVSMLRSVIEFNSLRMLALSLRAQSAEATVRQEQERMHEMRATVAGIRHASGTLNLQPQGLAPKDKHRLEQMMAAELGRLERLLRSEQVAGVGPVLLDDVIRPLVISEREQGGDIHWQPSGACAMARADEVTEVIHILLVNARQHAPGARVEVFVEERPDAIQISVRDEGPGISPEVGDRIFQRGERSNGSTGQGLGLHIAERLARRQSGALALQEGSPRAGAHFALTLQPVLDPAHTRPPQSTHT